MEVEQALFESEMVLAQISESSYVLHADSPVLLKIVRCNIEKYCKIHIRCNIARSIKQI